METKNKNVLIGGLLAIVFVMAVGYAAFATQLNINGTANITSNWHVGFDTAKTSDFTPTTGLVGATEPTGTIHFDDDQNATLTANFEQPGDKIVFTLTIKNTGTLNAKLGAPVLNVEGGSNEGLTSTKGNIKFTVTNPVSTTLEANTGETTMTVTAEFVDKQLSSSAPESATATITLQATQATE